MHESVKAVFGVFVFGATANAATVGMRWMDLPTSPKHVGGGTVEVYLDLLAGEDAGGIFGEFDCITGDCSDLVFTNYQAGVDVDYFAGADVVWTIENPGIGPHLGYPQFAGLIAAPRRPDEDALVGPGMFITALFDVSVEGAPVAAEKSFGLELYASNLGVIDANADRLVWDNRYNASYSGYVAYGDFGYPGWSVTSMMGAHWGQDANPLIITNLPEPGALAILGLSTLMLLRRSPARPSKG
ncbi:MAG: hypothetical protein H6817_07645 [Phycisphaerales bacterium]|nr:hypothetical protein [Phycisphaerales bacterium]